MKDLTRRFYSILFCLTISISVIQYLQIPVYAGNTGVDTTVYVVDGCNCISAGIDTLDFGEYDPINGNTAETIITIEASTNHHYTVHLDKGQNKGKGPGAYNLRGKYHGSPRAMAGDGGASNTDYLTYFIHLRKYNYPHYDNEDEDKEWGDNGSTYSALPASAWGTGQGEPHNAFGYLPPGQDPAMGLYCDLVYVTIKGN